jgi:hypothetical protein
LRKLGYMQGVNPVAGQVKAALPAGAVEYPPDGQTCRHGPDNARPERLDTLTDSAEPDRLPPRRLIRGNQDMHAQRRILLNDFSQFRRGNGWIVG